MVATTTTALCAVAVTFAVTVAGPALAAATPSSELHFAPDNPTYDPYGTGTSLTGDVSVTQQGWLDFFGRSVVQTPDRPNLNPGASDFSFGARIALTRGVGEWNVMQKGSWADQQWKLSTHVAADGAQLSCRVNGSIGAVHVFTTGTPIATDGSWHSVACTRSGDTVRISVDGSTVAEASGSIGSVSSTKPYLIGSKGAGNLADPDQYLGLLDDAFVSVGTPNPDPSPTPTEEPTTPPPVDPPPAAPVDFRGVTGYNANAKTITPAVPAATQPNDALLLFVTANRSDLALTAPAGWQSVERRIDETMQSQLWVRVAQSGDAGVPVRVATTATTKLTAHVLAYSGTSPTTPISVAASLAETRKTTAHTTPVVAATPGSWALSMWSNKSSATTGWTTSAPVTIRQFQTTSGSGRVTSIVADSGDAVTTSTAGGVTATASQSGNTATMWTVVLAPAG